MPKRQSSIPKFPPQGADSSLWEALVSDAGVAVKVMNADGVILYSNLAFAELVGVSSPDRLHGRTSRDYLPAEFAVEINSVIRSVAASGRPAMVRTIWRGRPVIGLVRAVPSADRTLVLCTVRPESPDDARLRASNGYRFVQSVYADEGPIAKLSPRERSVLSLIGAGLSTAQIARNLNRSVKTIENQRNSLGRKLNVSNRVELARIALDSGLTPPTDNHSPRRRPGRRAGRD
jgi:PAS domain S-box-containing protein